MSFRRAIESDVALLLALEAEVGEPKLYGPISEPAAALDEIQENFLYFLMLGRNIAGTAAYCIRGDGSVHISNLAVTPAHRRRGIARAAMAFILEQNQAAPCVDLVTHPENRAALGLYLSLGFWVEARRENHFGDGEPRLFLTKM